MKSNCIYNMTASRPSRRVGKRVMVAGRIPLGAMVTDQLRVLGWEVLTVGNDSGLHETAAKTKPHAVLLPEAAGDESGYLACAKLLITRPELKVVVVGAERTATRERFAEFVGAEFVAETDGVNELVAAVM